MGNNYIGISKWALSLLIAVVFLFLHYQLTKIAFKQALLDYEIEYYHDVEKD